LVGPWAQIAPASFYNSFPGFGRHWISPLGPYDEHLTRDVGGLYLALLVISVWAAARPRGETFALAGTGWLVFGIPHFIYHSSHLGMFGAADAIGNVVTLGAAVILPALLVLPARSPAAWPRRDGRASGWAQ
jgi:hypothetical protein